ncbi:hypothetical protein CERZMDRAFT_91474 [Cercospora zeae-maydis SCOH1-5]|uniref:Uncharacterized protein n=1 Tax=Cercospora zeae-maydis SCOH1-5 TaxID=717836 RepID=A0A6A6F827_9PEZI|nr:hypothetical protein CERZMDRAFT_91474 [Cercospora zeae-maydis SCOH1-5]
MFNADISRSVQEDWNLDARTDATAGLVCCVIHSPEIPWCLDPKLDSSTPSPHPSRATPWVVGFMSPEHVWES